MGLRVVKISDDPDSDAYAVYNTVVDEFVTYAVTEDGLRSDEWFSSLTETGFESMMTRAKRTGDSACPPFDNFSWEYSKKVPALRAHGRSWTLRNRRDLGEMLRRLENDDMDGALTLCVPSTL